MSFDEGVDVAPVATECFEDDWLESAVVEAIKCRLGEVLNQFRLVLVSSGFEGCGDQVDPLGEQGTEVEVVELTARQQAEKNPLSVGLKELDRRRCVACSHTVQDCVEVSALLCDEVLCPVFVVLVVNHATRSKFLTDFSFIGCRNHRPGLSSKQLTKLNGGSPHSASARINNHVVSSFDLCQS
jgi:hypothetical protein